MRDVLGTAENRRFRRIRNARGPKSADVRHPYFGFHMNSQRRRDGGGGFVEFARLAIGNIERAFRKSRDAAVFPHWVRRVLSGGVRDFVFLMNARHDLRRRAFESLSARRKSRSRGRDPAIPSVSRARFVLPCRIGSSEWAARGRYGMRVFEVDPFHQGIFQ